MNTIKLLPYQYDFASLTCPNAALIAGVGTGKTLTLAYMVLDMVSRYPKSKGMIVSNTYNQLVNSTLSPLFSVLDELNIPYKKNISGKYVQIINTKIYVYSLEQYDNIRGIEVGWIFADELAFQKSKAAYDVIKTRLRCKNGPLYFRAFSTKNGYNWFYDMYDSPSKVKSFKVLEAKTSDNIFLPEQFVDDLLLDYGSVDAPLYRQEVLNEYVNINAGSVYWSFSREKHVYELNMDIYRHTYVGVDFNIDQMSAVFVQYIGDTLFVYDEVSLEDRDSNTFRLAEVLQKKLEHNSFRSIVPDSTGKARKTSSTKSDHQILKDQGFTLEKVTNPLIRDRQNAVNKQFNLNKLVIHPRCKKLIKEIETLSKREDEGSVVHLSVALGYVINFLNPVKRRNKSSQFTYR